MPSILRSLSNFFKTLFIKEIPRPLDKKSIESLLTDIIGKLNNKPLNVNVDQYGNKIISNCRDISILLFRLEVISSSLGADEDIPTAAPMQSYILMDLLTNDSNQLFNLDEATSRLLTLCVDILEKIKELEEHDFSYYNRILLNDFLTLHNIITGTCHEKRDNV